MISFLKVTLTSLATRSRTLLAQIRGAGATGADNDAEPMDGVEVNNPIGFDSRPVLSETTELLTFRLGPQIVGLYIVDKGRSKKLGDDPSLDEGETRVSGAGAQDAMMRVRADGGIALIPKTGMKAKVGAESGTQPAVMGTDLNNYLENTLEDRINKLITVVNDLQSVANSHTHQYDKATATGVGVGTTYSATASTATSVSTSAAVPGNAGDPPALATIAEVK